MDPFWQLELGHVEVAIRKTPGKESLYELLKIATPSLQKNDILQEMIRKKAFKTLRLRIHPEKHNGMDTTALFQATQDFYEACCETLVARGWAPPAAEPMKIRAPYSYEFPQSFQVQDKWKFLDMNTICPQPTGLSDDDLMACTVATCVNGAARGAMIAHGQAGCGTCFYNG